MKAASIAHRRWRHANPEKWRAVKERSRIKNQEKNRPAATARHKRWRDANREKVRADSRVRTQRWVNENPDKARANGNARQKRWRLTKPDRAKAARDRYNLANPGKGAERTRQRRLANPEKYLAIQRRFGKRFRQDPVNRMILAMRGYLRAACKGRKPRGCFSLLDYTPAQLRDHLEARFLPGMTWVNYGDWHVDHIRPVSSFEFPRQLRECWALSNLQPLWGPDNIRKGAKWDGTPS